MGDRGGVGSKGGQPRLEASATRVPWSGVASAAGGPPFILLSGSHQCQGRGLLSGLPPPRPPTRAVTLVSLLTGAATGKWPRGGSSCQLSPVKEELIYCFNIYDLEEGSPEIKLNQRARNEP